MWYNFIKNMYIKRGLHMVSKYDNKLKSCKMGLYGILGLFVLNIVILGVTHIIKMTNNTDVIIIFVNICASVSSIYALAMLIINMRIKNKLQNSNSKDINKLIDNQKTAISNIRLSLIIMTIMFVLTWLV